MPRKKSKKSKENNDVVLEVNPEIIIDGEGQNESLTVASKSPENQKSLKIPGADWSNNSKTQEDSETASNSSVSNKSKKSLSLRKRLSFTKNKRNKMSTSSVDGSEADDASIRRSKSMSSHDSFKSKIPIGKFRSLHFNKKKKQNGNISSSCGNFDASNTNQLNNAETDAWRMTGLLDAVSKSNSMIALNTTNASDVADVSFEKSTNSDMVNSTAVKENKTEEPKKLKEVAEPNVKVKEPNEITNEETSVSVQPPDASHTTESIPEEDEDEANAVLLSPVAEESTPPVEKIEVTLDVKAKEGTGNLLSTKNFIPVDKSVENDDVKSTDLTADSVDVNDVNTTTTSEDTYELNEEQTITIKQLCDVLVEDNIDLPNDIVTSDWLVLNFSPTRNAIATC